jgi:hypothetical protein
VSDIDTKPSAVGIGETPFVNKSRVLPVNAELPPTVRSAAWPLIFLAGSLALAFGYRIFSFYLTIDEELAGNVTNLSYAREWIGQGRWTMGIITALIPNTVVPVVSVGLGVVLSGMAWWLICRRTLAMPPWPAAIAAALGGTLPTLAFIFSFTTVAVGVGVGNLLLFVFVAGFFSPSWKFRIGGVLAGAMAIGIYDTFALALLALVFAVVIRRPSLRKTTWALAGVAAAYLVSRASAIVLAFLTQIGLNDYTGLFMDIPGLLSRPRTRLLEALNSVWSVISVSSEKFGLSSPWLVIALGILLVLGIIGLVRSSHSVGIRVLQLGLLLGILLLPVGAEAISSRGVPLRSMIYLPIITLVLAGLALQMLHTLPRMPRRVVSAILGGVIVLAIVGNATVSNRLFASSETAFAQDRQLSFEIGVQKVRLMPDSQGVTVPIAIAGAHAWPAGIMSPMLETNGASFFFWDAGNSHRIAAFLNSQGVLASPATKDQAAALAPTLAVMPKYPADGWIATKDGFLLMKFS